MNYEHIKEHIKEWLDNQVEDIQTSFQHQHCGSHIRTLIPNEYVLMGEGIDIVADVMELELVETISEDCNYPYKYAFVYRNIEFIQIENKRLEKFNYSGTASRLEEK